MAKTKDEWQAGFLAAKNADAVIGTGGPSELSSTSLVAIWRLWMGLIVNALFDLGNLFDFHKKEVGAIIATLKPHTLQWYVTFVKAFQYGDALPADSDTYDPVKDVTDASRVVTFADAVEFSNLIRIKAATGTVGALAALTGPQMTSLRTYIGRVKDAGVRVQVTTGPGDNLQLAVKIYYDALIIDATGARIDGTAPTPVKDAINNYLNSLPFNGVFDFYDCVKAMRAVEGVKVAEPTVCQANYAAVPYTNIMAAAPNEYTPDAGYLVLDDTYFNANVTYTAL
jgi:hypothetical protein